MRVIPGFRQVTPRRDNDVHLAAGDRDDLDAAGDLAWDIDVDTQRRFIGHAGRIDVSAGTHRSE